MRVRAGIHGIIILLILMQMMFFYISNPISTTSAIKYFESENRTDYDVGNNPWSLCYGDFDKDGDLDIATANLESDNISVLFNNGYGKFDTLFDYNVIDGPCSIYTADLNGDDFLDLAICNGDDVHITVFINDKLGGFDNASTYYAAGEPGHMTGADFDNDGDIDLALCIAGSLFDHANWISILENDGNGSFAFPVTYETDESPYTVVTDDFNKDGSMDIATANYWNRTISVLINNGNGSFPNHVDYKADRNLQFLIVEDFNDDDYPDLVASGINVFINKGTGAFQEALSYGVYYDIFLFPGDIDSDGDIDVMTTSHSMDPVLSFYENNGDGEFGYRVSYKTGNRPTELLVANFDKNNHLDIAVLSASGDNVSIFLNNFKPISEIETKDFQTIIQDSEIELIGSGYDEDIIKDIRWTSDIDGLLSDETRFNISSLSLGNHTISFKIMDQHNIWSEEDTINILIHTPPEANIKNIYPIIAELDRNITFVGEGTDDGEIVAYYWNSDIIGHLSNKKTFTTNKLPIGNHTISLTVQDDCGVWSLPYNETITIMMPAPEPEIQDVGSEEGLDNYLIFLIAIVIIILICGLLGGYYYKKVRSNTTEPPYEVIAEVIPSVQPKMDSITCPSCRNIFQVEQTGYPISIQCPFCGQQGNLK
jgi:hypothetical protein